VFRAEKIGEVPEVGGRKSEQQRGKTSDFGML
jgi:hypothetical protein